MGYLLVRSKDHYALIVSQRKFNAVCTITIPWGKDLSKLKKEYSGQQGRTEREKRDRHSG